MAWSKALVKGAAVLAWLLGGAGILIMVFPWLGRLDPVVCSAIRKAWFQGLAKILRLHVEIRGAPLAKPSLVVSNHISWLDVIILGMQLPCTFVAKREVAGWPLIGFLARASGTLFVERESLRAAVGLVQTIGARLKTGERVVVFPEGTTTRGDTVLPFSTAAFQAALSCRLPVQAVALGYLGNTAQIAPFVGEETFLAHLWRTLKAERIEAAVFWAPPLPACERREVLATHARAAILAGMQALPQFKSTRPSPRSRSPTGEEA